jgi:hypothetical protein
MSNTATSPLERPKSAGMSPSGQPPAGSKSKGVINTIGHYEMNKNIGEGNFAKVRLARHTITGQQVKFTFSIFHLCTMIAPPHNDCTSTQ